MKKHILNRLERTMEMDAIKFLRIFGITWENLNLSKHENADVRALKARWAKQLLDLIKVQMQVSGQVDPTSEPLILVGNHSSYLDIPLVTCALPSSCFVSKAEVKKWPIIGPAATKGGTIFVKRESQHSRKNVRSQILDALVKEKKKVVIFPSGTTTLGPSDKWRKGPFEIAYEGGIKIQTFRIWWSPARLVAYIDDDFLLSHVFNLFGLSEIKGHLEFGDSFYVQDVMRDLTRAKAWCEG